MTPTGPIDPENKNRPDDQIPDGLIALPDGTELGIDNIASYERSNGEAQFSATLLKPGDRVAFTSSNETSTIKYWFDVDDSAWNNLATTVEPPRATITGTVGGDNVPDEWQNRPVQLTGSSWGSSTIRPNEIATGRQFIFFIPGLGEKESPIVDGFDILRKDNETGAYAPISPNQMASNKELQPAQHEAALEAAQNLIEQFGVKDFDITDFDSKDELFQPRSIELASRYVIDYNMEKAQGNRVAILDAATGIWVEVCYYNFSGEDVLKVAHSDMTTTDAAALLAEGSSIKTTQRSARNGDNITIMSTSRSTALETLTFHADDRISAGVGLPIYTWRNGSQANLEVNMDRNSGFRFPNSHSMKQARKIDPDMDEKLAAVQLQPVDSDTLGFSLQYHDARLGQNVGLIVQDPTLKFHSLIAEMQSI